MLQGGRIEIIDEKGAQIETYYKLSSGNDEWENGFKNYADRIVTALGDDWVIKQTSVDKGLIIISNKSPLIEWLTIVEVESLYDLAGGSVRRDIKREKFNSEDIKKVGRDWRVKSTAAKDLYANRVKRKPRGRIDTSE